jgi:hypothetical protein
VILRIMVAALLMSVNGHAEITRTTIAINWTVLPTKGFQTVNSTARVPHATLSFVRDVESISTDQLEILTDSGIYCMAMVLSSDSIRLDCGTLDARYKAYRHAGTNGMLKLEYVVETSDPPPAETPPPAAPAKKRVVPPPLPPNAKGKVRT